MTPSDWRVSLERTGVSFESGLRESEITEAEVRFGFRLPADLRGYLAYALPVGDRFPNWRDLSSPYLVEAFSRPWEGIEFGISRNQLWLPTWGDKPERVNDAVNIVKSLFDRAPKLIPLYGHRYLPDRPFGEGNPIFSVYQTDITFYGVNLENYWLERVSPRFWDAHLYAAPAC